jgi:cytochrome c oxidase subunit 2
LRRDLIVAGLLWLALSAAGTALALWGDFYPPALSDKGEEIEEAFRILVFFAIPVFTLVVAVLAYSVLSRSTAEGPPEDGPPLHGRGPLPLAWLGITTALTLAIMVYPGLVGIPRIMGNESDPDLLVRVEGVQWTWLISYPQHDIQRVNELVLPVDRTVRFDVTSLDVLHSFWVPAFLMKIDAVPGLTTTISLRPTEEGSFKSNPMLRVQCAELCGLGHSRMSIPVDVVSEMEFEEWVARRQAVAPTPAASPGVPATTLEVAAENSVFDKDTLEAPAGEPFTIEFNNRDVGVLHNVAIYTERTARESVFVGDIFPGPEVRNYQISALEVGQYFFRCDVHPQMEGTL